MRIAQLCFQRYPSPRHAGGGDVRLWQSLCSLRALGHEVSVVVCDPRNERTLELDRVASSVIVLRSKDMRPGTLRWLASRLFNPSSLAMACPDLRGLRDSVSLSLTEIGTDLDLIWAEEVFSVLLADEDIRVPIVHSHHDFHFKLDLVRSQSEPGKRLRRPRALSTKRLRDLELDVCRRAAHTVCASSSEAEFLRGLGISASYLPVAGPTIPEPDYAKLSKGRFFLFGNPNTAMKSARRELQTRVWPEVERRKLDLDWQQLGKVPSDTDDPSWVWLAERFVMHGFVEDLGELFLPGDASVMPYPFDTGGRVKFAVSAGYGVVNIAYEKTFECSEEFTHGVDCLAAKDPAHFAELLGDYASDEALRLRLARGSRAVYDRHFSVEALYPKYEEVLDIATNPSEEPVSCAS
ncbi:MAG: glycosyltransferase [Myxococcales bacterium]|nr:glycosyltransferase [Myxococcales bacterium]